MVALLATVQALPPAQRIAVERALVPLGREALVGRLLREAAHDAANALFGLAGLLDLLRPGEPLSPERVALLQGTARELAEIRGPLIEFARSRPDERPDADLREAAERAVEVARRGRVTGDAGVRVACPPGLLAQVVLHLLVTAEAAQPELDVRAEALTVAPAGEETLHELVAGRIAADHGGELARGGGAFRLRLPPA